MVLLAIKLSLFLYKYIFFLDVAIPTFNITTMSTIPVDVLRDILEHVRKADLATLCRVSKICCSCSQDVLYRDIDRNTYITPTLARSTDLARRVRSFECYQSCPELAIALRNMSSLRRLELWGVHSSVVDGCTFKLDSFTCDFPYSESLQRFLNSQSSLTELSIATLTIATHSQPYPLSFEETFLPNLTRVRAETWCVCILIPGRPVREVRVIEWFGNSIDFGIFTLSTAPIRKLHISYDVLYPTPGSHLACIFPSLEHLTIETSGMKQGVRIPYICLFIRC
jgi:hypothetical protein